MRSYPILRQLFLALNVFSQSKSEGVFTGRQLQPLQRLMITFSFTLFSISALFVAGGTPLASIIIGGLWVIGIYCFLEDQINTLDGHD